MNAKDHIAVKLSSLTPQVLQSLNSSIFESFTLGAAKIDRIGVFCGETPEKKV